MFFFFYLFYRSTDTIRIVRHALTCMHTYRTVPYQLRPMKRWETLLSTTSSEHDDIFQQIQQTSYFRNAVRLSTVKKYMHIGVLKNHIIKIMMSNPTKSFFLFTVITIGKQTLSSRRNSWRYE